MAEGSPKNSFENKCSVLSDLWMTYRFDKKFADFIEYNDIGLPLAFVIAEDLVKPAPQAKAMVEETYELLLAALDREDGDYESFDDLMLG